MSKILVLLEDKVKLRLSSFFLLQVEYPSVTPLQRAMSGLPDGKTRYIRKLNNLLRMGVILSVGQNESDGQVTIKVGPCGCVCVSLIINWFTDPLGTESV